MLLVAAPLVAGCRSYNDKVGAALSSYEAGDFGAAADELLSEDFAEERDGRRDGLLFRLEAAKALLDAGRYEESSAMFDRAVELVTYFDYQADISISEEAVTLLTDETKRDYRGTSYDRIQLEVYETLNYLGRNDLDEAAVHMRKAFARQAEAVARNADEIAAQKEHADSKGVSSKKVFGDPGYVAMEAELDTLVNPAYADYVNPCASLLSALLLREQGDTANAVVDLRKVIGMIPDNRYLRPLLEEFDASPELPEGRVYVLFESGMAPSLREFRLTLYTFQQGVSTFAIPQLVPSVPAAGALRVESASAGLALQTEHLASLQSIVATDFQSRLPGIVLRTVVSLVAKEVGTAQINRDSSGGELVFLAANIWKVATSQADLRTWRTMGSEYQFAVLEAPEDGQLTLSLVDPRGGQHLSTVVDLPQARTTVLYVRSPSLTGLGAHVMPIGSVRERTALPPTEPVTP